MQPITRALAEHIARTGYSELPSSARLAAKRSLLDAVGVSLGASGVEPACAIFAGLAAEQPGPCRVLGSRLKASPLMAALANGALAHALDYEDTFDSAPCHPNAASVPAALALCDASHAISGQQLITALALGSDLVCRLALALRENPDRYGFYTPPILNAFGATATAAKLLALNVDQIVAAFAHALSQATSSSQFKADPLSPVRAVRDAFPAQAGLLSAQLAQRGLRGFEAAIEGEAGLYALYASSAYDPQPLLAELGQRFYGASVSWKPWPSCRGTHAFIEAALSLNHQQPCEPDAIARIVAHGAPLNLMLMEPASQKQQPRTAIDAKFSLPYCIGLALTRSVISLDDFQPAVLRDPNVVALAARVEFVSNSAMTARDATSGVLELQLRSGERREQAVEHPLGHPANPLDEARFIAKFVDCAGRAALPLQEAKARALAAGLLAIDQASSVGAALESLFAVARPS